MNLKRHKTCIGCAAYLPDNPDWPSCELKHDIDLIYPESECWKPKTSIQLAIVKIMCRVERAQ